MNENPYAPPQQSRERSLKNADKSGATGKTSSNVRTLYVAVVAAAYAIGDQHSSIADKSVVLSLLPILATLFVHMLWCLSTTGATRWWGIGLNAAFSLTAFLWPVPYFIPITFAVHVCFGGTCLLRSYLVANRLHRILQQPDATVVLEKELRDRADSPILLNAMGLSYVKDDRFSDALNAFRRSLELEPGNQFTHGNIAWAFYRSGDFDQAEENYQRLLSKSPVGVLRHLLRTNYCHLLAETGRHNQASATLHEVEAELGKLKNLSSANRKAILENIEKARELIARVSVPSAAESQ